MCDSFLQKHNPLNEEGTEAILARLPVNLVHLNLQVSDPLLKLAQLKNVDLRRCFHAVASRPQNI